MSRYSGVGLSTQKNGTQVLGGGGGSMREGMGQVESRRNFPHLRPPEESRPVEEMDRQRVSISAAPTMCRVITFSP